MLNDQVYLDRSLGVVDEIERKASFMASHGFDSLVAPADTKQPSLLNVYTINHTLENAVAQHIFHSTREYIACQDMCMTAQSDTFACQGDDRLLLVVHR